MSLQQRAAAALNQQNAQLEEKERREAYDQWNKLRAYLVTRIQERFDTILLDLSPTPPSSFRGWMRSIRHEETVDGIEFTFDVVQQGYGTNEALIVTAYVETTNDGLVAISNLAHLGQLLEDGDIPIKETA